MPAITTATIGSPRSGTMLLGTAGRGSDIAPAGGAGRSCTAWAILEPPVLSAHPGPDALRFDAIVTVVACDCQGAAAHVTARGAAAYDCSARYRGGVDIAPPAVKGCSHPGSRIQDSGLRQQG